MNNVNEEISMRLYEGLKSKYNSEIQMAKATMMIYFNNPVAIGEHPQHLEEMDKLLESIATAEDKLSALTKCFSNYSMDKIQETRHGRASP